MKMMRLVGETAASIMPTMLGIERQLKRGHSEKFWKPVGEDGNW